MSWFDVKPVADSVTAFLEPGHFEHVISYLVIGRERAALIDTGLGVGELAAEVRRHTRLPVMVVNTHSHWDHRGENYKFDQIAIHHLEAAGLEDLVGPDRLAPQAASGKFTRRLPPGFWPAQWQIFPSLATRRLRDGDHIALGDTTLDVIHTPGHSPGSICLLDRARRLLFTGDTYYPGPLYAHVPGADISSYRSSAGRLAGIAHLVDWLLPGHNATPIPAAELTALAQAFDSIAANTVPATERDGETGRIRQYEFGSFSVLVTAG